MIKVKYIGTENKASFDDNTVYEVLEVITPFPRMVCYRILDELNDLAYYPWCDFLIVDGFDEAKQYGIKVKDPRII